MVKLSQKDRFSQKNPNILKVTGSNVTYTSDFKTKAVKLLKMVIKAEEIFLQAGIDVSLFGSNMLLNLFTPVGTVTSKAWCFGFKKGNAEV